MVSQDDILTLFGTDFRRFLYDNFSSTETINEAITQTGLITKYLGEIELSTGVQQSSTAKIYYNIPFFNPWYSTLMFKLQLTSLTNIFAWVGLKETAGDPTLTMTESHTALIIYNGNVYFSTGNDEGASVNYQNTIIKGVDPRNNIIYRLRENKFAFYPLPIQYPYFSGFRYEWPIRQWSTDTINDNYPPENMDHYFVAFIKNSTGFTKTLRIKHIVYGERYAD